MCDYFIDNYPIKINHKRNEPWGSAFIPVSIQELFLKTCEINSLQELDALREKRKTLFELKVNEDVDKGQKYKEYLPVYSLAAACGKFGEGIDASDEGWMKVDIGKKLNKDMFVTKVVGHSMEPKIPNNSYCVFTKYTGGSREGLIVLAQHHDISDPETGGSYTVKKYRSEKKLDRDGTLRHEKIILEPLNREYKPIVLPNVEDGEFKIIAEFVAVI